MKILIVSNTTKNNYESVRDKLKNHEIYFADVKDYKTKIKDFEYVIAGREEYTSNVLEKAKKLKIISRCGHGTDAIDKSYCKRHEIKVLDARGALDDTMADVTIGYMIMALRRLKEIDAGTREEGWKTILGNDLTKKIVGIVGLGGIGTAVAKRLQCFKTKTLFYDIDRNKQHDYQYAKFVGLNELLKNSDIVTIHCNLNDSSKRMINKKTLSIMKKTSILINTARGPIVDIFHLKEALDEGKISYAVLDVYPVEPLPKNENIREAKNVLLGSHTTCYSEEGQRNLSTTAVENLLNAIL